MTLGVGDKVWFPSAWEVGTLDSILVGNDGKALAYVIEKEDGTKVAVDMQVTEVFENE